MPTTDSNLTGTFIANTYQRLLQVDSQYGHTGTNVPFTQTNLVTTSKHSLLNGLGNKVQVIAIEGDIGGTGLFLKNTSLDPLSAWGISTLQADPANSNTEVGLSFWRPSPSSDNNLHKLFLKNTGTLWVGYEGPSTGAGTEIVSDVSGYNLYVRSGISAIDRVRTRNFNNFAENDIYVSSAAIGKAFLGNNQSYGVIRNQEVVLSGRCTWVANNGATLTNSIVRSWVINGQNYSGVIPATFTISGGYGGNGGDRSWINYSSATMYWTRVGGVVNVVIYITGAYGGDWDEPFPNKGIGRPMLFHYPVYLLDPSTLLPIFPASGSYDVIGNGITSREVSGDGSEYDREVVEVKTYTGSPAGNGAFMISIGSKADDNRDIRACFSYNLY